jgi:hypothetical protein
VSYAEIFVEKCRAEGRLAELLELLRDAHVALRAATASAQHHGPGPICVVCNTRDRIGVFLAALPSEGEE